MNKFENLNAETLEGKLATVDARELPEFNPDEIRRFMEKQIAEEAFLSCE